MPSSELARLVGHRLIARKDVKAIHNANKGHYEPLDVPWRMRDLDDHLEGKRSLGHYLLNTDNTTKLFAFDIDVDKSLRHVATTPTDPGSERIWELVVTMASGLGSRTRWWCEKKFEISPTVMLSYGGGKGMHVLAVFDKAAPATVARALAESILHSFGCFERSRGDIFWRHQSSYPELEIEVFPKQTELAPGGYGNLMRLPLGIHPKTGSSGYFVVPESKMEPDDPTSVLRKGSWR